MYSWIHVNDCNADTHDQYSVDWCASFVSDSMVDWVWWEERPQFIAMLVFWQNGLKSYVVISPPPALEMFALNDPVSTISWNSPTTETAIQRLSRSAQMPIATMTVVTKVYCIAMQWEKDRITIHWTNVAHQVQFSNTWCSGQSWPTIDGLTRSHCIITSSDIQHYLSSIVE